MFSNNFLYKFLFPPAAPKLPANDDGWFGKEKHLKGDQPSEDLKIRPFKVEINEEVLEDLRMRLEHARLPTSIEGTRFRYGFNSETLERVIDYWKHDYDWRKVEGVLNRYRHYLTKIEGIDVHFVHVKPVNIPEGKSALPLLAIHGWPGSFYEYYKTLDRLVNAQDGDVAFEVILPSIPGYGFSEAPHQEGFDVIAAARFFVKLMDRLGHIKFIVHGGDWGSAISKAIALLYPSRVLGLHTHMLFSSTPQTRIDQLKMAAATYVPGAIFKSATEEKIFKDSLNDTWYLESGYMHIQSTKPDTVAVGITDSPVGLAAYILEKFSTWTEPTNVELADGGLTTHFTIDELLTNVMIYWISGNVVASLRFYRENVHPVVGGLVRSGIMAIPTSVNVPVAYAVYPNEIKCVPRFMAEMMFPRLVQYSIMPRGGHFAAFEEPDLFVEDIKRFAQTIAK